jgi:hypothetical protein
MYPPNGKASLAAVVIDPFHASCIGSHVLLLLEIECRQYAAQVEMSCGEKNEVVFS